jgi:hypothetical protein
MSTQIATASLEQHPLPLAEPRRDRRMPLRHDWQVLAKSTARSSFLFLKPADAKEPRCCSEESETQTA